MQNKMQRWVLSLSPLAFRAWIVVAFPVVLIVGTLGSIVVALVTLRNEGFAMAEEEAREQSRDVTDAVRYAWFSFKAGRAL